MEPTSLCDLVVDTKNVELISKITCKTCKQTHPFPRSCGIRIESIYEGNDVDDSDFEIHQAHMLYCMTCLRCTAIWLSKTWTPVEEILHSEDPGKSGFEKVNSLGQRVILWTLNRIIFQEYDNDHRTLAFCNTPPEETAKILWVDGDAVGFYTVKPKGLLYSKHKPDCYQLPVVDLVFVRIKYRRRGLGMMIVDDIVESYPNEDVAFSSPVSESMYKVLEKYLRHHPGSRDYIWEAEGIGCEGYRKNIWMTLCRRTVDKSKGGRH